MIEGLEAGVFTPGAALAPSLQTRKLYFLIALEPVMPTAKDPSAKPTSPNSTATLATPSPTPPTPPAPKRTHPPLFTDIQAMPKEVVVLIYDFENFTAFLSIPDIHRDVARYLSFVDAEVRKIFLGGQPLPKDSKPLGYSGATIIHEKFLGDGVMLIAQLPTEEHTKLFSCEHICVAAWNLKHSFKYINEAALEFMPVADLPQRIRFGITYGTVLELTRPDGQKEYVGYPINLAARLQKYAGTASFLASARLPKSHTWMPKQNFMKVKAKALRGRKDELVYIDPKDFNSASKEEQALFERVSSGSQ